MRGKRRVEEEDLIREEIVRVLKNLREEKAAEGDGIPEVWKHEREQTRD